MRVLIAEDDPDFRELLRFALSKWGYEIIVTENGAEAWQALQEDPPPPLAILDLMMPVMNGLEVCQRVRAASPLIPTYLILLTAKSSNEDIVTGLEAGADDYLTKPCDLAELRARVRVGMRVVELQKSLAERVKELEAALSQVNQLRGILPICGYCKKIRDDQNYWQKLESYITEHSEAQFSHSVCPECYESKVKPDIERLKPR